MSADNRNYTKPRIGGAILTRGGLQFTDLEIPVGVSSSSSRRRPATVGGRLDVGRDATIEAERLREG